MAAAALALAPGVAQADDWWGQDKRLHLGAGAVIPPVGFLVSGTFLDGDGSRLVFGAGLSLTVGAAKELLWDQALGMGDPSWKDFAWGAIGTLLGVGTTWAVVKLTSSSNHPTPIPVTAPAGAPAPVRLPTPAPPDDTPTLQIQPGHGDAHDRLMLQFDYSAR